MRDDEARDTLRCEECFAQLTVTTEPEHGIVLTCHDCDKRWRMEFTLPTEAPL